MTADGVVHLVMYCPGNLGDEYTFEQVAEKAEGYLEFVLEGQLELQLPHYKGKPVTIRISCETWPHSQYKARFAKMARQLAEYRVGLLVDVSNLTVTGGVYDYMSPSVSP